MTHNPGSFEARQRHGCRCCPIRNAHGRGAGETMGLPWFDVADDCPVHHHGWMRVEPIDGPADPTPPRTPIVSSCPTCGSTRVGPRASGRPSTCCSSTKPRYGGKAA